ncbi:methionine-trna ligase [Phytophthora cinnamomi]|uniref:methionine-trna ligase n=1 Tax=Phytophthora cinnamomi TaxID=4785 RepID=UPI00355A810C|nr:methionine-trna ligase [Phytophthora cinnamomi]
MDHLPFDASVKRTESTIRGPDGNVFKVTKGTPQIILALAHNVAEIQEDGEKQNRSEVAAAKVKPAKAKPGKAATPLFASLDIRVDVIVKEMQNRKVLALLNLKSAKLGGFKSHDMVGERVTVASESGEPVSAEQAKKQEVLEKVSPDFLTDDKCVATYKGEPIMTSTGPCTVASSTSPPTSASAPKKCNESREAVHPYFKLVSSKRPETWNPPCIYWVSTTLGRIAAASSLLLPF